MVLRALLAFWFLVTSALGPALCCCSPTVPSKTTRATWAAGVGHESPQPSPGGCPHCKDKPHHQSSPLGGSPTDSPKPCPGKCPCQNQSLAHAVPDVAGNELRALAQFNWLPLALHFDSAFVSHLIAPEREQRDGDHTGPPPLSGIELLHRLHILIC